MSTPSKMSLRRKETQHETTPAKTKTSTKKTPTKSAQKTKTSLASEEILTLKDTSVLQDHNDDEFESQTPAVQEDEEPEGDDEFVETTKKRASEYGLAEEKPNKQLKRRVPRSYSKAVEEEELQEDKPAEPITPLPEPERRLPRSIRRPQTSVRSAEEQLAKELAEQQQKPEAMPVVDTDNGLEFSSFSAIVQAAKQHEQEKEFPIVTMDELEAEIKKEVDMHPFDSSSMPTEPLVRDSVAASIAFLYQRGFLHAPERPDTGISNSTDGEEYQPSFELTYVDSQGNKLAPKEAYRQLCRRFRGKVPGRQKMDKLLKRIERDKAEVGAKSSSDAQDTSQRLHEKLKEKKSAFLVVGK